jgi:hypothetical protein
MMLPSASEAVDLMRLTSRAADLFAEQVGAEQRKLLHLVLKEACWKGSELRMSLREPNFGNWRRGGDSNSRYP